MSVRPLRQPFEALLIAAWLVYAVVAWAVSERLTDEELAEMATATGSHRWLSALLELRRLRSDEWLEQAVEEIRFNEIEPLTERDFKIAAKILAILRKHRDQA